MRNFFLYKIKVLISLVVITLLISGISTTSAKLNETTISTLTDTIGNTSEDLIISDQSSRNTTGLVKILNYNTENAGADPSWTEVIRNENPDIFLQVETGFIENIDPWLSEVNSFFPDETPYDVAAFDGTSTTDGQAIYSRYPIINTTVVDTVYLDDGTPHGMNHPIMHAVVDIIGIEVNILVNHLSCCDQFPVRLIEQEGVINYIDSLGDAPVLYGGDFNSDSPEDVGDIAPLQGSLGAEPIGMMLNNSHPNGPEIHTFTDTYRALNPDRKGYTLNNEGPYASIDHFRGRIDYIFVSQHLTDFMVNSSVVIDYDEAKFASDHKPMYTWFNFLPEQEDFRPPLNPTNVQIEVESTQSTLNWDTVNATDLDAYNIYRNGSLHDSIASGVTTYVDTTNYDSTKVYKYEITALDNSTNEGITSLPVYADPDFGQLLVPQGVTISISSVEGGINIVVTIDDNSGLPIEYIKVYKAVNEHDVYIVERSLTDLSFNLTLREGFSLYYRVIVANAVGESDFSEPMTGIGGPSTDQETPSAEPTTPSESNTANNDFPNPLFIFITVIFLSTIFNRKLLLKFDN